jgi:hypothetical protein
MRKTKESRGHPDSIRSGRALVVRVNRATICSMIPQSRFADQGVAVTQ